MSGAGGDEWLSVGPSYAADLLTRFGHWSELLRDAAVASRGDLARPLRPERSGETRKLAASVSARDLLDAAMSVERFRHDLDFNANARMMLELFVLRLPYSAAVSAP